MYRKIYIVAIALGIILGISGCEKEEIENPQTNPQEKDHIPPMIYLLDKDGNRTQNADTTILLYTKFIDPGVEVYDSISAVENINVESDIDLVLPIERKLATHIGEVKKTGEFLITYRATDESGNSATTTKIITCRNVSDIYAGRYLTERNEIPGSLSVSDIANDTAYYSNVAAAINVAGRIRFSKVACHEYNGQKVSFKVDADLFSPELSPRTRSDQIGFLGTADNKEVIFYNGMSYETAVNSMRLNYVYLQIPHQEYTAYSEDGASVSEYKARIQGRLAEDRITPESKIVYDENGVMLYIELSLTIAVPNASGTGYVAIQNYIERYYPEQ
ncbi:MAG: hypothetical protein IKO34_09415 [Bacteroidales bacterium]|nr:hypothetical protein [Bacteroidales bacterium]